MRDKLENEPEPAKFLLSGPGTSRHGGNFFDELPARIRDIRSAEKVFRRKVQDIYAASIDYIETAFDGALPEIS